jgi:hypothetical protein
VFTRKINSQALMMIKANGNVALVLQAKERRRRPDTILHAAKSAHSFLVLKLHYSCLFVEKKSWKGGMISFLMLSVS